MNYASFTGVHRAKSKRQARRANTISGVSRHRAQLGFAHQAEIIHITDETLSLRKTARKRLVDEMFERVQQFAAFTSEHGGTLAIDINHAPPFRLARAGAKVETDTVKDVIEKLPRMKELQEKIKGMKQNDPRLKDLQMEQLRLMKEGNPLGGCLPLLIQMPFLIALYIAITISIDFRQSSFLWLSDLSDSLALARRSKPTWSKMSLRNCCA